MPREMAAMCRRGVLDRPETMKIRTLAPFSAALLIVVVGCVHGQYEPSPACSASPSPDARPFDLAHPETLIGEFDLRDVWTSAGREGEENRSRLRLDVNTDTLRRFYVFKTFRGYVREGDRPIIGTNEIDDNGRPYRYGVEVEDGVIYVGGRGGTDSSPTEYLVRAVSPQGFWGSWRDPLTGIGRPVGRDGKLMNDARGFFCAIRVAKAPRTSPEQTHATRRRP